jgi:hypothetical protein
MNKGFHLCSVGSVSRSFEPQADATATPVSCGWLALLALLSALPVHAADPVLVAQWPGWPRGEAHAVVVSGNYAYVAAYLGGLQVIDVSVRQS